MPWPRSDRTTEVARCFGGSPQAVRLIVPELRVPIGPGRIVAFIGPSGSGKSTALRALAQCSPGARDVCQTAFPRDSALVDAVAPRGRLACALGILSRCALAEAPLWLSRYDELSEGERFRARLARSIGSILDGRTDGLLLIDEFGASLHRRVARCLSHNVRRLATGYGLSIAIATSNEDLLTDLQPDTVVTLSGDGRGEVTEQRPRCRPVSLWRKLRIETGCKRDYGHFADMHYRSTGELGFVDRIFILREGALGKPLGIVVYSFAPPELALRNLATKRRFAGRLDLLNREMRILRRLVIHPDLRGAGIGRRFVKKTLPMVGTRFVECLAAMGAVNPVFERAGMKRIGVCDAAGRHQLIIERLRALGADPFEEDFEGQVRCRAEVRRLVTQAVARWYEATTGTGRRRAARQSPRFLTQLVRSLVGSRPVYYLWEDTRLVTNRAMVGGVQVKRVV